MIFVAIDPGPEKSAQCIFNSITMRPLDFRTEPTHQLISSLESWEIDSVICEMVASYGMPVGDSIFNTCVAIGEMKHACTLKKSYRKKGLPFATLTRGAVKLHLCGTKRAKDANVIQVLKDRFGEKGTKKKPGILYGIKADEWQALAVAVTYAETMLP